MFTKKNFDLFILSTFTAFGMAGFLGAIIAFFDMPSAFIGMWVLPPLAMGFVCVSIAFIVDWGLRVKEKNEKQEQD